MRCSRGLDGVVGKGGGFADRDGKRATFSPPFDAVAGDHTVDTFADSGERFLVSAMSMNRVSAS
jgi:hypothetical protein